ncbi:hypothetical protein ABZV87_27600 [Streptomyces tendae]|uniref:hypothetical protein n=1 Tax=Streptomyces tendae TaxID=1932 RepID=UPI0033AE0B87
MTGCVEPGHELAVCGPRGDEVLVPFAEFGVEIEDLLFQFGDPAGERLDVGGGTEAGGFPGGLSEGLEEASFQPGDVCGQTVVAGREVRDVGQQRLPADLRPARRAWRGFLQRQPRRARHGDAKRRARHPTCG